MSDNDDEPVGRVLTRREMLKLLALVGAGAAAGCAPRLMGTNGAATTAPATAAGGATAAVDTAASVATTAPTTAAAAATAETAASAATVALPTCVVRPERTEGPYFVDTQLDRSDIREEATDGVPLALTFNVSRIDAVSCAMLAGAVVDVWHCDALGVYSGVNDNNFGNTAGQTFLRGYQVTDADGVAAFTTIYPGWYQGRTVHIHFKIRTEEGGANYEFTSQLFFDEALSDQVFMAEPYATKGERGTRNNNDGIFNNGGDQLTLNVTPSGDGYAAVFDIGLEM